MRNEFAAPCYRCGQTCAPGEGHFEKVSRSQRKKWGKYITEKWLVQHAGCAIEYRGTDYHYKYRPIGEVFKTAEELFG
jgi:hypothetical protein